MAEAFSAAGEALRATASVTGGKFVITIGTDSVEVAKEVTKQVCGTITKLGLGLGALYAGYSLLKPLVDTAVKKALGGDRDDQDARDIRPGCLHVDLHCFTDKRFLEVFEDYESGKMKERLQEELSLVGIKVEGMKVKIENMEEVNERKEDIRKREIARRSSFGGYDEERFVNKVDAKLLCSICFKVVKDPVQCPNEHHFCRSCIQKWLQGSSETCPTCKSHLTEETLDKPPRFLTETFESLKIRCDHASRGCGEVVELEFLDRHVERCGYSPTRCTNTGCSEVISRNELERHENELCCFRRIICDECGEQVIWKSRAVHICFMRKEIDNLVKERKELKEKELAQDESIQKLKADIARKNVEIDYLRRRNREVECIAKEATERCDLLSGMRKIYVCGGRDEKLRHRSVESFSWPENSWTLEPEMNLIRSAPAAFVYRGKIYITCGSNGTEFTDSVERLNVVKNMKKWVKSSVKMPVKCNGHGMVSHENSAIFTGGLIDKNNASDGIYKIELTSPYTTTLLTQLPEMRSHHGCQIIDNQVVVAGGRTSNYCKDTKNTVFAYDINNNECKTLPPLPFPVSEMATVSYRGNIILIGGVNEKGETLNTVFMYEVKTGKIKELPRLNNQRAASAAVITGNMIIVMGGYYYKTIWLKIVECLDLSIEKSEWKELPPMTKERAYASAVLL